MMNKKPTTDIDIDTDPNSTYRSYDAFAGKGEEERSKPTLSPYLLSHRPLKGPNFLKCLNLDPRFQEIAWLYIIST